MVFESIANHGVDAVSSDSTQMDDAMLGFLSPSAADGSEPAQGKPGGGLRAGIGWMLLAATIISIVSLVWGGLTSVAAVDGHSMEQNYAANDLVLTLKQPSYKVGDVVSYKVPGGQEGAGSDVIHRISGVDTSGAEPVYSAHVVSDASAPLGHFTMSDVEGRAVLRVPGVGAVLSGSAVLALGAACVAGLVMLLPSENRTRATTGPLALQAGF